MTRRLWFFSLTSLLVLTLCLAPRAAALSQEMPMDEVFGLGEAVFVARAAATRAVPARGRRRAEPSTPSRSAERGEANRLRRGSSAPREGGSLDG